MLSIFSITSLDQGKLFPKPKNEDDYYARYMTAADKAEPAVHQKPGVWNFLNIDWVIWPIRRHG